jgi:superfamily I DNA/RNA helicase
MSWLIPTRELTPDQLRAVQMDAKEHRAIVGGPGSGKTQVLLHRARHLLDSLRSKPDRFRVFVYTNALKEYIRSAVLDLGLPEDCVSTFDQWCRAYYQSHVGGRVPWNEEEKRPDFEAIRAGVIQHARGSNQKLFDFVLVDEAQDLEEEVFAFLRQVSAHVTVCVDNKQQIYERGTAEAAILAQLGIRKRNVSLIEAFRVCPYLVEVAAQFIPDLSEREAFRNQTRQPQVERQTPLIYSARNFEDERERLFEVIRERLLKNERVAIFLPQNRQVYGFARGLTDAGIPVEVPPQRGSKQALPAHDFASPNPKLMAFHSAKGLTFDSVFMPRLTDDAFPRTTPERVERLLFVGITRATRWCYFSSIAGRHHPMIDRILWPLAEKKLVTVRKGEGTAPRTTPPSQTPPSEADDLDFL